MKRFLNDKDNKVFIAEFKYLVMTYNYCKVMYMMLFRHFVIIIL